MAYLQAGRLSSPLVLKQASFVGSAGGGGLVLCVETQAEAEAEAEVEAAAEAEVMEVHEASPEL